MVYQVNLSGSYRHLRLILWFLLVVLLIVGWVSVTDVVGPRLLDQHAANLKTFKDGKYQGEAATAKLEKLHRRLEAMKWLGIAAIGACALLIWLAVGPQQSFAARVVGRATPTSLGGIRILVCSLALISLLWEDTASIALLPDSAKQSMGMMILLDYIPGFEQLHQTVWGLNLLHYSTMALLVLALLGWRTHWIMPLATIAYLVLGGVWRAPTHFFHEWLLPLYLMMVLSVTPCGDGLAITHWFRRPGLPPADRPMLAYGWPRFAIWSVIAATYGATGIAKIRNGGWDWWNAHNLRFKILDGTLRETRTLDLDIGPMVVDWPDLFFASIGLGTILLEIGMILVPFSRWARRVLPGLIALMHIGILLLQNILFLDMILLPLIFYDHSRWLRRLLTPLRDSSKSTDLDPQPVDVEVGPTDPSRPWRTKAFAGVFILVMAGYVVCIACRIEFYPISAWQMYSHQTQATKVKHHKIYAVDESKRWQRIRLDECAPILADGRYRDLLMPAMRHDRTQSLDEFLQICANQHNSTAPTGDRIVRYEVEQWEWDFVNHRNHPNLGEIDKVHVYTVKLGTSW